MVSHYYSKNPSVELSIKSIEKKLRGNFLFFDSPSGVFSFGKIDTGSELLINKSLINDTSTVLDLGCGYGPVGISIAKAFPECRITMSDLNERAIKFSKINAKKNNVKVKVILSEGFAKIKEKFDVILFNPPQSAGKKLCINLMKEAKTYLSEKGNLQAVMRHNVGGKDMAEKVRGEYSNLEIVSIKSGYRIYLFEK